jgi:hypothetical protein
MLRFILFYMHQCSLTKLSGKIDLLLEINSSKFLSQKIARPCKKIENAMTDNIISKLSTVPNLDFFNIKMLIEKTLSHSRKLRSSACRTPAYLSLLHYFYVDQVL